MRHIRVSATTLVGVAVWLMAMLAVCPAPAATADDDPNTPGERYQRRRVTTGGGTNADTLGRGSDRRGDGHRVSVAHALDGDTLRYFEGADSVVSPRVDYDPLLGHKREFNPDPTRALWMSALCPGLGQIYNRRYWKLPIVAGAFVGLGYGTSWNNRMLRDYTKAYSDLMDNDPSTRSYMNFYPPTTQESSIDKSWLEKSLKNKKSYYRRYRDLCIIGMVGVYLLAIVDAYVDASLAHFDVSDDLSLRIGPKVLEQPDGESRRLAVGMRCAVTF